ncbi:MAG: hypothetical protein SFY66_14110 [Oculatellaceae cyanobacterium bins.114]|nr:hypothetical protein [Oculatellaceae cyanobacterium bins.114]
MQNSYLADFYHGWLIEVMQTENGFQSICYSPARERLSDYSTYSNDFQALAAAKKIINKYVARHVLTSFIRELYELEKLDFEEWRSLNQSLINAIATI